MSAVGAQLKFDSSLSDLTIKDTTCFSGAYGSTAKNCTLAQQGNILTVAANGPLAAGENISFVVSFPSGSFVVQTQTLLSKLFVPLLIGAAVLAAPIVTLFVMFRKWRKFGRDPKGRGTIIAEYQPPADTSVLINDYVLHESSRDIAITAQLINLAIRGYVKIIDSNPDSNDPKGAVYSLELSKDGAGLSPEELQTVQLYFDESAAVGSQIKLSDLQNKLSKKASALQSSAAQIVTDRGLFSSNPQKAARKYYSWGGGLLTAGFIILFIGPILAAVGAGLALSGIIMLVFAKAMPARTAAGVALHDYLLGLKLYIQMAEQERIRFHQSPENAQRTPINPNDPAQMVKLFESLLPYAMLFGMEKEWGKQFEQLYATPPDWYYGNPTAFSTGYLIGSINNLNTAAMMTFSPPAGSGGSGFSGGGFSGGGGGGGGGGGW